MEFYTISDIGRVRKKNEDAYLNISGKRFSLHAVCDGMGGHNAGEYASNIAIESISEYIKKNYSKESEFKLLENACKLAHENILEESKRDVTKSDMGTTVVLSLFVNDVMYFANIGDSRIYLFRENELMQLTKDHSYIQELLDKNVISEEEAKFFPKNQITSAIGLDMEYRIDLDKVKLSKGDVILLVTDGLTDLVEDMDIEDVLRINQPPRETCEILAYIANSTGGKDNITVTCVKI